MMADPIERMAPASSSAADAVESRTAIAAAAAAADIDGASVMSRATMYSYSSKRRFSSSNNNRGYRTEPPPKSSSVNGSSRQQRQQQQQHPSASYHHRSDDNDDCSKSVTSTASGSQCYHHQQQRGYNSSPNAYRRSRSRSVDVSRDGARSYDRASATDDHDDQYYERSSRDHYSHPSQSKDRDTYYRDNQHQLLGDRIRSSSSRRYGEREEYCNNNDDARYRRSHSYRRGDASPRGGSMVSRDESSFSTSNNRPAEQRRRSRSEGSRPPAGDRTSSVGRGGGDHDNYYYDRDDRSTRAKESPSPPAAREWPPCFETDGSAFVFDGRSGMFYESLSDFFYDPKSKLYYGNKKCAYFQYDDSMSPAFVEIQKVDAGSTQHGANTQDQEALLASAAAKDHTTMSVTNKSKIAIKLKTKKLKSVSSTPVSSSGSFVVPSKSHKDQIANIEKWTEKQAELKNSVHGGKVPLPDANSGSQHPQPSARLPAAPPGGVAATISASSKIRMTAKGEPVCLICKRKFPTVDKLRLHEKASDLHKQNLRQIHEAESNKRKLSDLSADLTAFGKTTVSDPPTAPTEYEDRAQKRRQLHGPDVPFGAGQQARSFSLQFETQRAPPAPLDETNVGHQMLQKLGWKGGDKSSQEGSADGSDTRSTSSTHQLRKDWDRIEAIAGNPAQQQQPNNS